MTLPQDQNTGNYGKRVTWLVSTRHYNLFAAPHASDEDSRPGQR